MSFVVFCLCYVQSLVCVMRSLYSVLCVAHSVSGSLLKRLVAALLIPVDRCVYMYMIYIYTYIYIYIWQFLIGRIERKSVMVSCPGFSRSNASDAQGGPVGPRP